VEIRHLRYFIAVAEELSFSRAAKQCNVSVPPLSRQIRQLEEELGTRLFVRDKRRVALTDAGHALLLQAKSIANQIARIPDSIRLAETGRAGAVRIGIGLHLAERLSPALMAYSRQFPNVEMECRDIFSALQNRALVEGEIDVGFLRPRIDPVHLNSEALFEERLVVHVNKRSPLARRKALRVSDLAGKPLVVHSRSVSSGLYDEILRLYAKAGATPEIVQLPPPVPHGAAQRFLMASRDGVFIVPDEAESYPASNSHVTAVPLDEPGAKIDVHMAWRKNETSAAVLTFLDAMRNLFRGRTLSGARKQGKTSGATPRKALASRVTKPVQTKQ
jgi:DNA-binding transcriptional LysR family regulator